MSIYGKYAEVYDSSGQILFALHMIPYLEALLDRHKFPGNRVLDLACGTGTIAMTFASKGYDVTAIDGSEQMIGQARKKVSEHPDAIAFSIQDMRSFEVQEKAGLVTCLYDSMNYMLTEEDLLSVMRRVYDALEPGGLFMFDMNTQWMLEHTLGNKTEFFESGTMSLIMQETYDAAKKRSTVKLTGFAKKGMVYEKFVEVHEEQSYSEPQMYRLLQEAGFLVEGEYACFTMDPPSRETTRIMWVARKAVSG